MNKRILILFSALALFLTAAPCFAGEYLAGAVSNEDWMIYYGRGNSEKAAMNAAVRACGGTDFCRQEAEVVSSGQCIALVDSQESVSMAWGTDPKAAIKDAMKRCKDGNRSDCHFVSLSCAR